MEEEVFKTLDAAITYICVIFGAAGGVAYWPFVKGTPND